MSTNLPFPDKKYQLILADPPWSFNDKGKAGHRGASEHYNDMDWRDIAALPVRNITAENCLLAMWWVGAMPREAWMVADAWGFKFKTMKGFTWAKIKNEKIQVGMGHWTRGNTEDCLFAVRGKPKRVDASVRQLIIAPRGEHSQKPTDVHYALEKLCGDVPRIELFARYRVLGWDAWGLEI